MIVLEEDTGHLEKKAEWKLDEVKPSVRVVADEDNISYMKSLLFVDCVRVFNLSEWVQTDLVWQEEYIFLFIEFLGTGIHLHHIEMSYINKEYCLLVNGKIWIFQKWDENFIWIFNLFGTVELQSILHINLIFLFKCFFKLI